MLQVSVSEAPNTEKLRQKLTVPVSAIVSPTENTTIPSLDLSYEQVPRCRKCQAYISNYCAKDENTWTCAICGNKNDEHIEDFLPNSEDLELKVMEKIGIPITCVYIDIGFCVSDIDTMKPGLIAFLRSFVNTQLIIMLGIQITQVTLLCPHKSYYTNTELGPVCNYSGEKPNLAPAPAVNFTKFPDDLTPFIFHTSQIESIVKSIELISSCPKPAFATLLQNAYRVSEYFPHNPIHFIAISHGPALIPDSFKSVYSNLLAIDILTPQFTEESIQASKIIPGRILFFRADTFLNMLAFATRDRPTYQLIMGCRCSSGKTEWKLNPYPVQYENKGVLVSPVVPLKRQPYVLDIHPNGGTAIRFQVTAKYTCYKEKTNSYESVLRIFNRKVSLTEDVPKILSGVDANALMWLWITRSLSNSSRDVIAALFRVIASYIGSLPQDSPSIPLLTNACCSLRHYDLASENKLKKLICTMMLCSLPPRMLSMAPDVQISQNSKRVCTCLSGVFADDPQDEKAVAEALKLGYTQTVESPIPDWCLEIDQKSLEFLESLLPDH